MNVSRRSLLFVMIILLSVNAAYGATYYVSPSGNDANQGSALEPWRTIGKCATTITGGDICVVRDGTYTESVTVNRSGTEGNPIVFKAENRHGAVIVGKISIRNNAHYVRVDGFKVLIENNAISGISSSGNFNEIFNNLVTTESTSLGLNNTAIRMEGNYSIASGNYVEKTCFGYYLYGSNNIFQNNEATRLKLNGDCGDVDYMRFFGSNHLIRNNTFHGINFSEIGGAHVDCFQTYDNNGPQYSISNVIVEGNYCSDSSQGMMLAGGMYMQSQGLIVRNNVFAKCTSWCVCLVDIANAFFYNNTCDTTGGIHGMWCRGAKGIASCEFKNNIIYGPGSLYGVMETATLIDGTSLSPGKKNLLYKTNGTIRGFEDDIVNKDPLFENRAVGNYRLKTGSPGIDAGMPIPGWSGATDQDGRTRPQGKGWDIGAYEHGGANLYPPRNLRILDSQ